jgi:hypothetical protein
LSARMSFWRDGDSFLSGVLNIEWEFGVAVPPIEEAADAGGAAGFQ